MSTFPPFTSELPVTYRIGVAYDLRDGMVDMRSCSEETKQDSLSADENYHVSRTLRVHSSASLFFDIRMNRQKTNHEP